MADVVAETLPRIIENGAQCALLGDGDRLLEERFKLAARHHPGRIAVRIGYEEPLAHRLMAGGDILLHPARFEPCGLTQLYAMRYGTLPVVRNTGGLCDTVVDATDHSVRRVQQPVSRSRARIPPICFTASNGRSRSTRSPWLGARCSDTRWFRISVGRNQRVAIWPSIAT